MNEKISTNERKNAEQRAFFRNVHISTKYFTNSRIENIQPLDMSESDTSNIIKSL